MPAAERDVIEAIDYLWPLSEAAVSRLGERIDETTARLSEFPDLGQSVETPGLPPGARSVLVEGYRLVYVPSDERIRVLRAWGPRRQRPQV